MKAVKKQMLGLARGKRSTLGDKSMMTA